MSFTQVFPSDYRDQVAFFNNLLDFAQVQDANSLAVGVVQPTTPLLADLTAAWAKAIGDSRAIPPGARILWWDTSRNVLDQIYSSTNDLNLVGSSGALYELSPKRKGLDMGVIQADTLVAPAVVIIPTSVAALVWTHVWMSVEARLNNSVALAAGVRTANATAAYYNQRLYAKGAVVGRSAIAVEGATFFPAGEYVGNTQLPSQANYYNFFFPHLFNNLRDKMVVSLCTFLYQMNAVPAPIVSASRWVSISVGFLNGSAVVTDRLVLGQGLNPAVLFEVGTTYVAWGLR